MEKDYFLDRPLAVQDHLQVFSGRLAYICTKDAQKYAKTLNDLKLIKINNAHTSVDKHPRGQKVTGMLVNRDIYGNEKDAPLVEEKGRCTYFVEKDGNTIDTKEGLKRIAYNGREGLHLVHMDVLKDSFQILACFKIVDKANVETPFLIRCPFCPYLYFRTKQDLLNFLNEFGNLISNGIVKKGNISFNLGPDHVFCKTGISYLSENKIVQEEYVWKHLFNNYTSIRQADLIVNSSYYAKHIGFLPKKM